MKVVGADHTNFRVKDLDASLGFYLITDLCSNT